MANVLNSAGNYQKSKELYEQSIQLLTSLNFAKSITMAKILMNYGILEKEQKNFEITDSLYSRAFIIYSLHKDEKPDGYFRILYNQANLYRTIKDYNKAIQIFLLIVYLLLRDLIMSSSEFVCVEIVCCLVDLMTLLALGN